MLNQLILTNFKSYLRTNINFRPLTVMSGLNSAGKSTVIQSLLLLRQSYYCQSDMSRLLINGDYVDLGSGREILNDSADINLIGIGINGIEWQYHVPVNNDESDVLKLHKIISKDQSYSEQELFSDNNFEIISAERVSPSLLYSSKSRSQLGTHGEYAYSYLNEKSSDSVPQVVRRTYTHDNVFDNTLRAQVNAWMDVIAPGTSIRVQNIPQTHNVQPRILAQSGADFSPVNSGFGITYALPVILAMLKGSGKLILLENPEVHIHPRGQRMLGELIARSVASGAQVILETHSDHILNGIRLAVKHNILDKDQVGLNYVEQKFVSESEDENDKEIEFSNRILQSVVDVIYMADDGSLDHWPKGFFDEWNYALRELMRP
ncbi:hypothetical protein CPA40_09210 [Bifidobacterium callitrichos]|uniref:DUF3696 domain-containing protein n=1 Tax=Bifidobacterium callitrichos TaxID=762209 RepID=A0A2T3G8F6_9BIFI|nr:DUF3696 domain-containing protein [Bifidobacterium callitrichos]PST45780.1 hypothetical protein CPA40_09210 [Bifidobacterium callitrichos]